LQRRWYATSMCVMDYPNYSLLNGLDRIAKAEMPLNLRSAGDEGFSRSKRFSLMCRCKSRRLVATL
jgi:hypothetical protein